MAAGCQELIILVKKKVKCLIALAPTLSQMVLAASETIIFGRPFRYQTFIEITAG
jgi:hypothetical protein